MKSLIYFLLFSIAFRNASGQEVISWPGPEGMNSSTTFTVQANGKDVFVYESMVSPFAVFDFKGTIEVKIRANRDVKWVDIRPKSLNIKPVFKDSLIWFTLSKPCNLSIELNGEPKNAPLMLFTNSPEQDLPELNSPGVISFEPGKVHEAGIIRLQSGQTLYIPGGTIVKGLVVAEGQKDVRIMGRGILDGSKNRELRGEQRYHFISLRDCRDVLLRDLILIDATTWQVVPMNSENVRISNVRIVSNNGSDDGIDVVRSRNVKIDRCFIHTKDDCIAIKSFGEYPSDLNVDGVEVWDCVFWNTEWGNALEIGFELRSDFVRNIVFRDSDVIRCEDGAVFSIHNGDRSIVENVVFRNIRVEDARQKLIDLAVFYGQYSMDRPATREEIERRYLRGAWDGILYLSPQERKIHAENRGQIRNIVFEDISLIDGIFPFSLISGFDEKHKVSGVIIKNLRVHGEKIRSSEDARMTIEHAENISFK